VIASELLQDFEVGHDVARPEADPFTEEDALQEAALVDVRINALSDAVGLLFDLGGALQLRMGSTGILIAQGIDQLRWVQTHGLRGPIWYSVVRSTSQVEGDRLTLGLDLVPDTTLRIRLRSGTFYVGDVPGLADGPPPDFTTADADTLWSRMVSWESEFEPSCAVVLEPRS
jgi:hypothetical protein